MWSFMIWPLMILTVCCAVPSTQGITTDGCGQTFGCLRFPSGCELSQCTYLATYQSQGDQATFELYGKDAGWVSIGFNENPTMAGTDAVFCYGNNGNVLIRSGKLTGYFLPQLIEERELNLTDGSVSGGSISCRFRHPLRPDNTSSLRNLNDRVYLIYARGPLSGGNPSRHGVGISDRGSSEARVNVTDEAEVEATSQSKLKRRVHGSLMVAVWIIFASTGLFFARYTRNNWSDIKILDKQVWFQFHRSLMITVVLGTIVSIVIIFVDLEGFTKREDKTTRAHLYLGLAVLYLSISQPIGAFFRPHPGTARRPIFNIIHRLVGLSAFILSLVVTILGLDIFEKKNAFYVVVGYVGFLGFVVIIMEIIKLSYEKNGKETGGDVMPGGMAMANSVTKTKTVHLTLSKIFLGILVVVSIAVGVVVIYLINDGEN